MRSRVRHVILAVLLLFIQSCDDDQETYKPAYSQAQSAPKALYVFGVHPLHNPARLLERGVISMRSPVPQK